MSSKMLYVVNKTKTGFVPSVKIDLLTGTYCTERILNKSQLIEFRHALSLHKYPYVSNSWIQTTMLFRKQNKCFAVLDRLALWLCLVQFALLNCERWQNEITTYHSICIQGRTDSFSNLLVYFLEFICQIS